MKKNILLSLACALSLNFSGLAMNSVSKEIEKTDKEAQDNRQQAKYDAAKRDQHEARRYNEIELARANEAKAASLRKANDNIQYYQDKIDAIEGTTPYKSSLTKMVEKYTGKSARLEKESAEDYLSRKAKKAKNAVVHAAKTGKKNVYKLFGKMKSFLFSPVDSTKGFYKANKKACIIVGTAAATVAVTLFAIKNCRWLREKLGLIDEEKDQVIVQVQDEHGNYHPVVYNNDFYQPAPQVTVATSVVKPVIL